MDSKIEPVYKGAQIDATSQSFFWVDCLGISNWNIMSVINFGFEYRNEQHLPLVAAVSQTVLKTGVQGRVSSVQAPHSFALRSISASIQCSSESQMGGWIDHSGTHSSASFQPQATEDGGSELTSWERERGGIIKRTLYTVSSEIVFPIWQKWSCKHKNEHSWKWKFQMCQVPFFT